MDKEDNMSKAKAAVMTGVGVPLEIREYELMEPQPGRARVKMAFSGVCGTDIHILQGRIGVSTPVILGHEMVGRIDAISEDDAAKTGLKKGDGVIVNVASPCGCCKLCSQGDEADCLNFVVTYVRNPDEPPHFFGGYGQVNDSPVENLIRIPERVPLKAAAVFACAGPTVFQALSLAERANIPLTSIRTAVVQGMGPVGAFAVMALAALGVEQVILVTAREKPERAELARSLGAAEVLSLEALGQEGVRERIMALSDGMGADLAVEASGRPEAFPQGLAWLRPRGIYLVPGQYSNAGPVEVEPQLITLKALQIFGSAQYNSRDVARYLAFMEANPQLHGLIQSLAACYNLEQVNEALADAAAGRNVKTLLKGEPAQLTKDTLKEGLRSLGVGPGMKVMVHSSLKSFGHVEGGADTVVDALMELLTPEGTLVMPSFNHEAPYEQGEVYDAAHTPTINGIIPDTFWRRPGVMRSINPTHPFAAWGKDARRYTEDHQKTSAMGPDSPLGRLMEDGGYCLLLGVGYTRNTFHHYVETCEGAPCLRLRGEVYPVRLADGTETTAHTWSWRGGRCPIDDGALYAPLMAGVDRRARIGDADVTLYKLSEGYEVIARPLREGLAGYPPCSRCAVRPRVCRWTVED